MTPPRTMRTPPAEAGTRAPASGADEDVEVAEVADDVAEDDEDALDDDLEDEDEEDADGEDDV